MQMGRTSCPTSMESLRMVSGNLANISLSAPEHERLDIQAMALNKLVQGEPFRAPVQGPKKILDIGCGTGILTVQLAKKFPDAQVIGLDISPVPDIHDHPSNVEYIQGDFLELADGQDARLVPGTFDYVFSRLLHFGVKDWPRYVSSVLKVLAPGGWAEIQENAPGVPRKPNGEVNHELQQLKSFRVVLEDFSAVGLDLAVPGKLPGWFRDSGFVDIRNFTFKFPITKPLPTQTESKSEREAAEFLYEYHQKYILPMMGTVLDKLSRTLRGEEATNEGSRSFSEWQSQAAAEPGTYVDFTIVVGQKPLQ